MARNPVIYKKMRPAPHGSKRGWRVVGAKLPPDLIERMETVATARGEFVTAFIERAIRAELDRAA